MSSSSSSIPPGPTSSSSAAAAPTTALSLALFLVPPFPYPRICFFCDDWGETLFLRSNLSFSVSDVLWNSELDVDTITGVLNPNDAALFPFFLRSRSGEDGHDLVSFCTLTGALGCTRLSSVYSLYPRTIVLANTLFMISFNEPYSLRFELKRADSKQLESSRKRLLICGSIAFAM